MVTIAGGAGGLPDIKAIFFKGKPHRGIRHIFLKSPLGGAAFYAFSRLFFPELPNTEIQHCSAHNSQEIRTAWQQAQSGQSAAEDCKKRRAAQNPNFPLEVIDRMADSLGTDWRDIAALFRGKIITIIPDGETGADEA
mgnify:CR=1 FL=1